MCTRQSRRVIWDMINTLFLTTVAVETNFFTFLWHSQTYVRGLPCNSFKFLWRTGHSKLPTIPFGVVACTFSDNLSQNTCIRNAQGGPLISVQCISSILEQKLECLNRIQIAYQILAFLGVISKEKKAASSREISGKFCRPLVLLRTLMKTCWFGFVTVTGCKESHFYSLPFRLAEASIY